MKKKVMEKWVAALRSGKFKQTTGALRDETGHCCLGVLCELAPSSQGEFIGNTFYGPNRGTVGKGNDGLLPDTVREWAGMDDSEGVPKAGDFDSLVDLNDNGKTFPEIADIIETHYKEL